MDGRFPCFAPISYVSAQKSSNIRAIYQKALTHPRCRYRSYGSVAGHRFLTIALLHSLSRNVRESPKIPAKDSSRRFCLAFSPLSLEQMGFLSHPRPGSMLQPRQNMTRWSPIWARTPSRPARARNSSIKADNAALRPYLARLGRCSRGLSRSCSARRRAVKVFVHAWNLHQLHKRAFPCYAAHVSDSLCQHL